MTHRRAPRRSFPGNPEHLERITDAIENAKPDIWNRWRKRNPSVKPDLRGVNLSGAALSDLRLDEADLSGAWLARTDWWQARLAHADLRQAFLEGADLQYGDLRDANLDHSRLLTANLTLVRADRASFRGANLSHAVFNGARLFGADLRNAIVTGTSTWGIEVDATTRQTGLVVHQWSDPLEDIVDDRDAAIPDIVTTVDDFEAAHLVYLLRSRAKFERVLAALIDSVVLLLGNFSLRRKAILHAIAQEVAHYGYIPVVFDFDNPRHRDLIETVSLLAGFSRFIVADLTRPRSTPLESMLIAPNLMVPFAPIIQEGERPFSMFATLQAKYHWVLPVFTYKDKRHLIRSLEASVIVPCEKKLRALDMKRAGRPRPRGPLLIRSRN